MTNVAGGDRTYKNEILMGVGLAAVALVGAVIVIYLYRQYQLGGEKVTATPQSQVELLPDASPSSQTNFSQPELQVDVSEDLDDQTIESELNNVNIGDEDFSDLESDLDLL